MSDSTIDDRMQVIADLRAARDELERRGWAQGDFVADDGRVCAIGAVRCGVDAFYDTSGGRLVSEELTPRVERAIHTLEEHLPVHKGRCSTGTCGHLDCYNDRKADAQDVLDLFNKALAELGGLA